MISGSPGTPVRRGWIPDGESARRLGSTTQEAELLELQPMEERDIEIDRLHAVHARLLQTSSNTSQASETT